MGFWDYLKKFIADEKQEKPKREEKPKEESLIEIENKLISEQKEILGKKEKLENDASLLIKNNIPALKECHKSLKEVNLDKRTEDNKLKEVVIENLKIYQYYLEKLIDELEKSQEINKTAEIFELFLKNSNKSYQRATILIGKEFETIQILFKRLTADLNQFLRENLEKDTRIQQLKNLEKKFDEIEAILVIEKEINETILKLKQEISKNEEQIRNKKENLEKITKSRQYIEDLQTKEEIKEKIKNLENEILRILQSVNLKELAKICHGNEKKHKLIQNYITDYKKAIVEDEERNFEKIVKETKNQDVHITEITQEIKELNKFVPLAKLKAEIIEKEIEDMEQKIKNINESITEEEEKTARFKNKKQEIENQIRLAAKK